VKRNSVSWCDVTRLLLLADPTGVVAACRSCEVRRHYITLFRAHEFIVEPMKNEIVKDYTI
jgi:hypothetical protein